MVGTVGEACPGAPDGGAEYHDRQEEEDAGDLKPQNAAYPAKRAEKTAYATGYTPGRLSGDLAGGAALGGDVGGLLGRGCIGRGFGTCRRALAGDAAGDTQADSQGAAD